jgi:adenylate cyclase
MTDFTAMGESVNAAFRLETATKDLQTDVVLGQTTYQYLQLLPKAPKCFQSAQVKLKGYDDPAEIWHTSFVQLRSFLDRMENESLLATVGRF